MNVRWDAVVDRKAGMKDPRHVAVPCLASPQDSGCIRADVQLFGVLAALSPERRIQLELPPGATIADLLAALGERLGEAILVHVLDPAGKKHRHCRLYVDGYPVEDVNEPVHAKATPTQVEIILLIAPEGG